MREGERDRQTDQAALDAIGLDHDEGDLIVGHGGSVAGDERGRKRRGGGKRGCGYGG